MVQLKQNTGMVIKKKINIVNIQGAQSNDINYKCYSNIYEWSKN